MWMKALYFTWKHVSVHKHQLITLGSFPLQLNGWIKKSLNSQDTIHIVCQASNDISLSSQSAKLKFLLTRFEKFAITPTYFPIKDSRNEGLQYLDLTNPWKTNITFYKHWTLLNSNQAFTNIVQLDETRKNESNSKCHFEKVGISFSSTQHSINERTPCHYGKKPDGITLIGKLYMALWTCRISMIFMFFHHMQFKGSLSIKKPLPYLHRDI